MRDSQKVSPFTFVNLCSIHQWMRSTSWRSREIPGRLAPFLILLSLRLTHMRNAEHQLANCTRFPKGLPIHSFSWSFAWLIQGQEILVGNFCEILGGLVLCSLFWIFAWLTWAWWVLVGRSCEVLGGLSPLLVFLDLCLLAWGWGVLVGWSSFLWGLAPYLILLGICPTCTRTRSASWLIAWGL